MKITTKAISILITAATVLITLPAGYGYFTAISNRKEVLEKSLLIQAKDLPTQKTDWSHETAECVEHAIQALVKREISTHLRECSEEMQRVGLSGRSISTGEPFRQDGLVIAEARLTAHGTQESIFEVLRSPALNCDGVFIKHVCLSNPQNKSSDALMFELELVFTRPQ